MCGKKNAVVLSTNLVWDGDFILFGEQPSGQSYSLMATLLLMQSTSQLEH